MGRAARGASVPAPPRVVLPAIAALYLVLAVAWAAPSSLSPTESVPSAGDPLHLAWVLAWDAHQLVREFPSGPCLTLLARLGIATVVVHPLLWEAGERERRFDDVVSERFAAFGLGQEGAEWADPRWSVPELHLYRRCE